MLASWEHFTKFDENTWQFTCESLQFTMFLVSRDKSVWGANGIPVALPSVLVYDAWTKTITLAITFQPPFILHVYSLWQYLSPGTMICDLDPEIWPTFVQLLPLTNIQYWLPLVSINSHYHCGQSITAYSVRLMFATVRLLTKSHCHPLSHKNVYFFVIFKPFLSSVSSMDM